MKWVIDVATLNGIVMYVLKLLQHHRIVIDLLWLTSLLPELITLVNFVTKLVISQLLEQRMSACMLK
jgi:hypothetical protein